MGRKLLVELDWFNRDVHQLRIKFHVRCGLNAGEVMVPDDKPLEDISDETIDVAGHLQKYAAVDRPVGIRRCISEPGEPGKISCRYPGRWTTATSTPGRNHPDLQNPRGFSCHASLYALL